MNTERRKYTDHDVVLTVVKFVGWCILVLALSSALSLAFMVIYSTVTGQEPNPNVLPLLIAAVSNPMSAALGYMAGLLQNSRRDVQQPTGTPTDPVSVTAPPGAPVNVVEQQPDTATTDAAPPVADFADVPTIQPDAVIGSQDDDGGPDIDSE